MAYSPSATEQQVFRIRTPWWKVVAAGVAVIGTGVSIGLGIAIFQIDGAASSSVQLNPTQDVVGISALAVGVSGLAVSIVTAVRWWRRAALEATTFGVTVYNRRMPVVVVWPMIRSAVPGHVGRFLRRGEVPALDLVNGDVLPARFARVTRSPTTPRREMASPTASSWLAEVLAAINARRPASVDPTPGTNRVPTRDEHSGLASRTAKDLPGPALAQIRARFPWSGFRWLLIAPVLIGFAASLPRGAGADSGALAVVDARWGSGVRGGLVVAAVFEVAALLVIWSSWSTLTRQVAIGEGWLAWRPRAARRWRTLPLFAVVSTLPFEVGWPLSWVPSWPRRGVRLTRANGDGIFLREAELDRSMGSALGAQLVEHPAATSEALDALRLGAGSASPVTAWVAGLDAHRPGDDPTDDQPGNLADSPRPASELPTGSLIAGAEVHLGADSCRAVIHAANDQECEPLCQPGRQLLPTFSKWETLEPKWVERCPRCVELAPAQRRPPGPARPATHPDVIWIWGSGLNKMTVTADGVAFRQAESARFRTRFLPWAKIDGFSQRHFTEGWCIELVPGSGRSWRRRTISGLVFKSASDAAHGAALLNKALQLR